MDAKSAEYFLALLGDDRLPTPEPGQDWYAQRARLAGNFRAPRPQAWRALERLEHQTRPARLAGHAPPAGREKSKYKTTALPPKIPRVSGKILALCGFLGDTKFPSRATLVELHRLQQPRRLRHRQLRRADSRRAATQGHARAAVFKPAHDDAPPVSSRQLETAALAPPPSSPARRLPARRRRGFQHRAGATVPRLAAAILLWMVKQRTAREICSLFFGDTSAVDPALEKVSRRGNKSFAHVPAVTVPPGIGIVF